VRNFLNVFSPEDGWSKWKCGPDLTVFYLYLWSTLKNTVYGTKPRILQDLMHGIEIACAAIPPVTLQEVCPSL
jgi:hypothetical protein